MKSSSFIFSVLLLPALFVGCDRHQSTPPGPTSSFGVGRHGIHGTFLSWDEGLSFLLVDLANSHNAHGSSSTRDEYHRHDGRSTTTDGKGYDWNLATKDGREADLEIDGQSFDLNAGAVFVIEFVDDGVAVHQLDLDLAPINGKIDNLADFIAEHSEISEALGVTE